MSVLVGCLLGIGLLLVIAPFIWPGQRRTQVVTIPNSQMRLWLNAAGFNTVPATFFVILSILLGLTLAAIAQAFFGVIGMSIVVLCAGTVAPVVLVRWRGTVRARANQNIWPDIVDHIVSAVRSGLALPDSIILLGYAGPTVTQWAFREFEREYTATGSFQICVDELKIRLADPAADRILETIKMAREVGGTELTGVLRSLGNYLRVELALRQEVNARQSWIRNAAKLGVAAPWIILLLLSARPEAQHAYNSVAGIVMIIIGFGVSTVAYRVMLSLGHMPENTRCFA
jgi:tight adherence protein B